jgi:hypothetical protein
MEDYIFLILAIAISIFGALKKSRKKATVSAPVVHQEEKEEDKLFGDWFDKDFQEEPELVHKHEPAPVFEYKAPEVPKSTLYRPGSFHSTIKRNIPSRTFSSIQTSVPKVEIQEEPEEIETEIRDGYLEDFSLRKAVIYSEIMKPKFQD